MEYINPLLTESVLEKTMTLLPKTNSRIASPVLDYHHVLMERGRKPENARARQKDDMTLSGMKFRLALYIVFSLCAFSIGWFVVGQHVFNVQVAYVGLSFALALIFAIFNRQKPGLSEFVSPLSILLFGFTLGGIVQFFSHDIREACLYFIGIPISVASASFLILSEATVKTITEKSLVAAITIVSIGFLYLYVLALEFLVHIPIDFPHQIDLSYLAFVILYMIGAAFCVLKDYEIACFGILNGAKKTMESYMAFSLMGTMFFFYMACAYCVLSDD